jgi:hypothetical protein
MFDQLYKSSQAIARHEAAPYAQKRSRFLLEYLVTDRNLARNTQMSVVCRAIWDSDATINETRFDRAETRCRDPCAVSHNRLW